MFIFKILLKIYKDILVSKIAIQNILKIKLGQYTRLIMTCEKEHVLKYLQVLLPNRGAHGPTFSGPARPGPLSKMARPGPFGPFGPLGPLATQF